MNIRKLINAAPLLIGITLIFISCRSKDLPLTKTSIPTSQVWRVKEGSIYDGDTLRVVRGPQELKIRSCGIDAPEKKQPLGIKSRGYLRAAKRIPAGSLVAKGGGEVYLVPIEKDRYGRTVAELFVPQEGTEEEIFLNAEMVKAGLAYHYKQYSGNCPNREAIATAEEMAKKSQLGAALLK